MVLTSSEKELIEKFIHKIDITSANIYKEYEFIYNKENITYHGIIDLLLEYVDHIKIIDYKLKNIKDKEYLNQLNGYKNYIENKFGKNVKIYLYSVLENNLEEIT